MKRHMRRAAPAVLALLAVQGCDSTEMTSSTSDRVKPSVTLAVATSQDPAFGRVIDIGDPLEIGISASDDAQLQQVVTHILLDDDTITVRSSGPLAAASYQGTLRNIPLSGARTGQTIRIVSIATDAAGNESDPTVASASIFNPNVPAVTIPDPQPTVIPGGTYAFAVSATDALGITKLGYQVTGAVTGADSALRATPYLKTDSVGFTFQVSGGAQAGQEIVITPFAENVAGIVSRSQGVPVSVRVVAAGPDVAFPVVYQTVAPRLEFGDSISITARDADGLVASLGFVLKDSTGATIFTSPASQLGSAAQQVTRKLPFDPPINLRGRGLFVLAYAVDQAGHTGWAVPTGQTNPIAAEMQAKRDPTVYAFGHTTILPTGSLGGDIAVDETNKRLFVSNINMNRLEVFDYGTPAPDAASLTRRDTVPVGAMPWGLAIHRDAGYLLVANSGGTNISMVTLAPGVAPREEGRIRTSNEWVWDVTYSIHEKSGLFKFGVDGPFDYSDRPQYLAVSQNGAIYYSTRPTSAARPGTLRRIDARPDSPENDPVLEPRQIWQYASRAKGHILVMNSEFVGVIVGADDSPDQIEICDHPIGSPRAELVCEVDFDPILAVERLRQAGANTEIGWDRDRESLALPDTNFVAAGGDGRRVAFGEANTGNRAGRVILVTDLAGMAPEEVGYSEGIEVVDLTNNASDKVFGLAINSNSRNVAVHGVETFFADTALRLQGKYATFQDGAGVAFHPDDDGSRSGATSLAFVASADNSIQIVDSYSYRIRGRIPIKSKLYGPLRAAKPGPGEDPTILVKLFGLTPEGVVVIDVRQGDIKQ